MHKLLAGAGVAAIVATSIVVAGCGNHEAAAPTSPPPGMPPPPTSFQQAQQQIQSQSNLPPAVRAARMQDMAQHFGPPQARGGGAPAPVGQ